MSESKRPGAARAGRSRSAILRVAVAGATGRMGREVILAVGQASDLALVGAVARGFAGSGRPHQLPLEIELASDGVATFADVETCLRRTKPDVLVEFTSAAAAPASLRCTLEAGVSAVSGTTGMPPSEVAGVGALAEARGLGAAIIPNFSLGATVLSILARNAAPYFAAAEIVELHHDQKRDAPSGTALALAKTVSAALMRPLAAPANPGVPSRGLAVDGIPVHSVRLSGLMAHHELIFASAGETLTLRHDSISRASFMPGVLLAVRNVGRFKGLVTSLERLLELARPDASGV